jgi:F-type H+-transporting ATPase subunit b|tara:strand:- start:798 stop:1337 length:540 start_codon:yes stop_codon:yes gene_type:complete
MENFNQIFTLVAKSEGIGLNLDILETGLINVLTLVGILVYTGKDFLGSLLEERKTNIVQGVQDAEDRLNEANRRLDEAQKQLSQYVVVTTEIQSRTIDSVLLLFEADAEASKKDLATRFSRALATFRFKERQIFAEVKQQIVLLVLKRTLMRAQETFSDKKEALVFNGTNINKLQGDLL